MSNDTEKCAALLQDIKFILRDLLKAIKVVSLYPENNPLPQSLKRTVAERMTDIVAHAGGLDLSIEKTYLTWRNETVFTDQSKEESLAGLFFDQGITRIVFKAGLEVDDIYRFLDLLKTHLNSYDRARDLAAAFWEAGMQRFAFETIEDIALAEFDGDLNVQEMGLSQTARRDRGQIAVDESGRYATLFTEAEPVGDIPEGIEDSAVLLQDSSKIVNGGTIDLSDSGNVQVISGSVFDTGTDDGNQSLQVGALVEAMGLKDLTDSAPRLPDTTLILNDELQLSHEVEQQLALLTADDAMFDPYEATAELLKELVHQETELSDFEESVTTCEKVLTEFVDAGKLTYAADVLRYFKELESRLRNARPQWAARLRQTPVTFGSREKLKVLTKSLNAQDQIGSIELRRYLDNFDWQALMGIAEIQGSLESRQHRECLSNYLAQRGESNLSVIAHGLTDARTDVVCASIIALSRIDSNDSLAYLKRISGHRDMSVRLTLAEALQESRNDISLAILSKLAYDDTPDVRHAVVAALVARRGQPAFDAIGDIIDDDRFVSINAEDQASILAAYSRLGGDMAVEYLVGLITRFNPMKDPRVAALRDAAFGALAVNRSEKCEKALLKLRSSWRPDVKRKAKWALEQRRELMFGGSDGEA
ncbi:MAG: HEAT repeat domain-containing protein [candidate division Zixibacteria bacterium]|nr:HEAT repeat domain-containing protein [candidate division Zixibacteria bacterium]